MAGTTTVHVRVSFTIPQRLEICDKSQAQTSSNMDAVPAEQQTAITMTAATIMQGDKVYLLQTILPK
jgi:6-phosphogluconolactonase/glucosamine-6-phosphate isomerase/deaminase